MKILTFNFEINTEKMIFKYKNKIIIIKNKKEMTPSKTIISN